MRNNISCFHFLYISPAVSDQTMDNNIIINCCEDSYNVFKKGPGDNHHAKHPKDRI